MIYTTPEKQKQLRFRRNFRFMRGTYMPEASGLAEEFEIPYCDYAESAIDLGEQNLNKYVKHIDMNPLQQMLFGDGRIYEINSTVVILSSKHSAYDLDGNLLANNVQHILLSKNKKFLIIISYAKSENIYVPKNNKSVTVVDTVENRSLVLQDMLILEVSEGRYLITTGKETHIKKIETLDEFRSKSNSDIRILGFKPYSAIPSLVVLFGLVGIINGTFEKPGILVYSPDALEYIATITPGSYSSIVKVSYNNLRYKLANRVYAKGKLARTGFLSRITLDCVDGSKLIILSNAPMDRCHDTSKLSYTIRNKRNNTKEVIVTYKFDEEDTDV